MSTVFSREIPTKTFKERIQMLTIIYFSVILFLIIIGLNLPEFKIFYLVILTCAISFVWILHVFLTNKIWFNKIEITENEIKLYGFDINRQIVRYVPFENYSVSIEFNNLRRIEPEYYCLRLKSDKHVYLFNTNNEWSDQEMFDIVKELKKLSDSYSFFIDGIHYLSDLEQRAKKLNIINEL